MRIFTFEQERVIAMRILGRTGDVEPCSEEEAERRLRAAWDYAGAEADDCDDDGAAVGARHCRKGAP